LFYQFLKLLIRLGLKIFCRRIELRQAGQLKQPGPLLVIANHPNSFLDAVIIAASFRHPVHFLARGDAFHKPWHNRLLRLLNMVPVYRLSEGRENLDLNTRAFEACRAILSSNGIVLIFIEGICINSHRLQPFKKGAARIAEESIHLDNFRVLPLGIAYDSLSRFGKTIVIDAGTPVKVPHLLPFGDQAKNRRYFNEQLFVRINHLIHIPDAALSSKPAGVLALPAIIGWLLHAPLYLLIKTIVRRKTRYTVFYDSVLFGALFVIYPLYLIAVKLILLIAGARVWIILIVLLLHPLTALCVARGLPLRKP